MLSQNPAAGDHAALWRTARDVVGPGGGLYEGVKAGWMFGAPSKDRWRSQRLAPSARAVHARPRQERLEARDVRWVRVSKTFATIAPGFNRSDRSSLRRAWRIPVRNGSGTPVPSLFRSSQGQPGAARRRAPAARGRGRASARQRGEDDVAELRRLGRLARGLGLGLDGLKVDLRLETLGPFLRLRPKGHEPHRAYGKDPTGDEAGAPPGEADGSCSRSRHLSARVESCGSRRHSPLPASRPPSPQLQALPYCAAARVDRAMPNAGSPAVGRRRPRHVFGILRRSSPP